MESDEEVSINNTLSSRDSDDGGDSVDSIEAELKTEEYNKGIIIIQRFENGHATIQETELMTVWEEEAHRRQLADRIRLRCLGPESDRQHEFRQYWEPEEDAIANAIRTDAERRWRYIHNSGLL